MTPDNKCAHKKQYCIQYMCSTAFVDRDNLLLNPEKLAVQFCRMWIHSGMARELHTKVANTISHVQTTVHVCNSQIVKKSIHRRDV